jgi:hypothetical protein
LISERLDHLPRTCDSREHGLKNSLLKMSTTQDFTTFEDQGSNVQSRSTVSLGLNTPSQKSTEVSTDIPLQHGPQSDTGLESSGHADSQQREDEYLYGFRRYLLTLILMLSLLVVALDGNIICKRSLYKIVPLD